MFLSCAMGYRATKRTLESIGLGNRPMLNQTEFVHFEFRKPIHKIQFFIFKFFFFFCSDYILNKRPAKDLLPPPSLGQLADVVRRRR